MQVMGLAKIQLAEDFSYEGAWQWNFKAENTRNLHNCVKMYGFGSDMAEDSCLVNFVGKWSSFGQICRSPGYWDE